MDSKPATSSALLRRTDPTSPIEIFFVVLTVSVVAACVHIELTKNISENLRNSVTQYYGRTSLVPDDTLVVADSMDAGYLDHVVDTPLDRGYKLSFTGKITPEKAREIDQYQLIWTHDYTFEDTEELARHQRINHFPGTGFITNKMSLSTTPRVPHLLKAFRLPAEKEKFLRYAEKNREKLWIQKSSSHRGICIETAQSVRFDLPNTLVQEYMASPLLIDGKKFDIEIYAVLTSIEPLRAYIDDAEALLRFCSHTYLDKSTQKFKLSDIDSFVGDYYTPAWLIPSLLRQYISTNLSMKQTLNTSLKQLNKSGDKIWLQIDKTIMSVYKMKEHHLAALSRYYREETDYNGTSVEGSLDQFFEMVRFDFIINEDLNVFLIDTNMSPNLSSRHFPPNRLIYEQVLQSYFSLFSLGQFAKEQLSDLPVHYLNGAYVGPKQKTKQSTGRYGLDALISDKELSMYEELCVSDECHMNCESVDYETCYFCLSYSDKLHLKRAIYEECSKWDFKRLLPSTRNDDLDLQLLHPETREQNTEANYIHVQSFRGKCSANKRFCNLSQLELKER